jgi:hypothetical protein
MLDCFIDIVNKLKKRFLNNSKQKKNQDLSNQLLKKTEWL